VDQLCWYVDVAGYALTGRFPVGVAKYMVKPSTTAVHIVTGTHHLWFLPLCLGWMQGSTGAPQGSYALSVGTTAFIACAARALTPFSVVHGDGGETKEWNINLAYAFFSDVDIAPLHALDHASPAAYLPFLVITCNFVLNVLPVGVVVALSRLSSPPSQPLLTLADFTTLPHI